MNKKSNLLAFLVIGIVGTLWHFLFEWSGGNEIIGAIAPINESVWEHQKLLFFPSVIYSLIEYFAAGRGRRNYISAVSAGIISGNAAMIILFYTYSGILGYSVTPIDIAIFFIGVIVMLAVKIFVLKKGCFCSSCANALWGAATAVLLVLFVLWSFFPPSIAIFTPPAL